MQLHLSQLDHPHQPSPSLGFLVGLERQLLKLFFLPKFCVESTSEMFDSLGWNPAFRPFFEPVVFSKFAIPEVSFILISLCEGLLGFPFNDKVTVLVWNLLFSLVILWDCKVFSGAWHSLMYQQTWELSEAFECWGENIICISCVFEDRSHQLRLFSSRWFSTSSAQMKVEKGRIFGKII